MSGIRADRQPKCWSEFKAALTVFKHLAIGIAEHGEGSQGHSLRSQRTADEGVVIPVGKAVDKLGHLHLVR